MDQHAEVNINQNNYPLHEEHKKIPVPFQNRASVATTNRNDYVNPSARARYADPGSMNQSLDDCNHSEQNFSMRPGAAF